VTRLARTSLVLLAIVLLASAALATENVRVTAERVNLRSGPGTNSRIIGKVDRGAVLEVLGRQGSWIRVMAPGGGAAYISATLCETVPSAPPTSQPTAASPAPASQTSSFGRSRRSSQVEPLRLGLHAAWANKGIDFGLGGRASAGIPGAAHFGGLLTLDYFFGARATVDAGGAEVDVSGHSLQLGLFPTYAFDLQGVQAYAGVGLSYFRSSFTSSVSGPNGSNVEESVSASSTSLGVVAGARFNRRFFGELRYQFGDASHLTLSAGILFGSPF
jgi:hypothetical protein